VTDVDDDILRKAREVGVHYLDLAAEEMAKFDSDMAALGLLPAYREPRATSAIADILSMIEDLLESGNAYESGGAVYFDRNTFDGFGSLSHYDEKTMLELAAERGGNPDDPNKRHPLDFVLWQQSAPDEPAWESRWGSGRPGWHIECSALVKREIGVTVDIHGGGSDLIFPHHECEIAQSESANQQVFARHWMHVGMVGLDGIKMSKSLGNLVFVRDLLTQYPAQVVRLALLAHHYRSDWQWTEADLQKAVDRFATWRDIEPAASADQVKSADHESLEAVRSALDEDLDAPGALDALDALAESGTFIGAGASLLGITL
jgi:L-cysteine:1D-myo-inositol 2-amino-2-deoxy-alpha-D-glucopyranoside ligase